MTDPVPFIPASDSYADYLDLAVKVAEKAGDLLRENYETDLAVNELHAHDIKLEMDVRSQDLITERLLSAFPDHALYGEEGIAGNQESDYHWIVDPIDGTVNYFFGIPHFCVSIALRHKDNVIAGVVHDPMMRETFAVALGGTPTRNGRPIHVSGRSSLAEAVITVGFSKTRESLEAGLERFRKIADSVRKTRMLGSAALALSYIACGRLDAYIEESVSLWDIAAGQLLVEMAGGRVEVTPFSPDVDRCRIMATNGSLSLEGV